MTNYLNFHPGEMQNGRSIWIDDSAAYGVSSDVADFVDSMILGCVASIATTGIADALEDGELLGHIAAELSITNDDLQGIVEEMHAALTA
jgi:hypothetical protein